MAQASRRLLLRGVSQALSTKLFSAPSSVTVLRSFSEGPKLFVGGLSFRTSEEGLRDAFAAHGEVMDTKIIVDRETGRSRGFGFITYYKEEDADTALAKLNGHTLDGRVIRVDRASSRPPRPMGGGGFGGGGFGSGSGGFSGLNDPPEPPADEDWGTIPSLSVDAPGVDADLNRQ